MLYSDGIRDAGLRRLVEIVYGAIPIEVRAALGSVVVREVEGLKALADAGGDDGRWEIRLRSGLPCDQSTAGIVAHELGHLAGRHPVMAAQISAKSSAHELKALMDVIEDAANGHVAEWGLLRYLDEAHRRYGRMS